MRTTEEIRVYGQGLNENYYNENIAQLSSHISNFPMD